MLLTAATKLRKVALDAFVINETSKRRPMAVMTSSAAVGIVKSRRVKIIISQFHYALQTYNIIGPTPTCICIGLHEYVMQSGDPLRTFTALNIIL